MNTNQQGLRIITNLHCNNHCIFCYQKNKDHRTMHIEYLRGVLDTTDKDHMFEYATIMGGESTLLPNLAEYIELAKSKSKVVRLTTNGRLLSTTTLYQYKKAGLDGINISIASIDPQEYRKIHGTTMDVKILLGFMTFHKNVMDFRINIPLCQNSYDNMTDLLDKFVVEMGLNVTICEDIKGTYTLQPVFEKLELIVVEKTNYGLILVDYKGKTIGYYTHAENNYNETDLVVTPLGTYIQWDGYCEAVGMNQ